MATKPNDENWKTADAQLDSSNTSALGDPPPIQKHSKIIYRKEKTSINNLKTFIEPIEKNIFKHNNYRKIKSTIYNQEKSALKDIKKIHRKHITHRIINNVLLFLIVMIILKKLIVNLNKVLLNC